MDNLSFLYVILEKCSMCSHVVQVCLHVKSDVEFSLGLGNVMGGIVLMVYTKKNATLLKIHL